MTKGARLRVRRRAVGPVCAVLCPLLLALGCKREAKVSEEERAVETSDGAGLLEDGSAPPAPEEPGPPPRCQPPGTKSFRLRGRDGDLDATESGVDQPFAVEVGGAVSLTSGFAVGALRHDAGRTEALVALVDPRAERGRIAPLGRVHGGAEPPRLVARGDRLFLAVVDSDASGPTLRLARLDADGSETKPVWGPEVQQGRDESSGFSVAVGSGDRGLLVWDDHEASKGHSVVRMLSFRTEAWGEASSPKIVTPDRDDAEAPLLAPRPGGYWLAWIARAAAGAEGESAAPSGEEAAEEGARVLDGASGRLRIAPLDERGNVVGEPRFVTPARSQVVVFDLASAPGGGARLSWRDESRAPGAAGGPLSVALVAPDGTIQEHVVEAAGLDAGFPALLQDESLGENAGHWLAAYGTQGATLLGVVTDTGVRELRAEPALLAKQALAAGHGRILVGQPRGVDLLLETAVCSSEVP
ncbi:MAG: hypothetical protein GX607_08310 [Myxococcales bacterium]|nr:hypothetical protein [Myxococcales bacterium]